jgi:deoxyribodipyrimidine photo-lyase
VPELAKMPAKYIHAPWTAPLEVLNAAGVFIGMDYPRPMVDHADARKRALAALAAIKGAESGS